jgi:hypothetical protein
MWRNVFPLNMSQNIFASSSLLVYLCILCSLMMSCNKHGCLVKVLIIHFSTDLLFLDQYALLLVYIKRYSQHFIFTSLLHVFSNHIVSPVLPYSCVVQNMYAYAEFGLFALMYLICSRCLIPSHLPVWPLCKQLQVLHLNLHMQLEFFGVLLCFITKVVIKVYVAQNVKLKYVYLNKLVTLHISGLHYVKETHFFFCVCMGMAFVCSVLSINLFSRL